MRQAILGLSILLGTACTAAQSPLDLVVINGRVFTGTPAEPSIAGKRRWALT